MFDPKHFSSEKLEQVAQQIHDAMPQPVKTLGSDIEQKIRQVIQGQLAKLDVVNREEFDVQTQVLLRTREKLTDLENKLAALENQLASSSNSEPQ